jgi:hypothetical protein
MDYLSYFHKLADSQNNLLLSEPVKLIMYDKGEKKIKYLLVVPLSLNFPFIFFPLSLIPKIVYYIAFHFKSKFRLGFLPMFPAYASEVLFYERKI